jgi:hypothetical protein
LLHLRNEFSRSSEKNAFAQFLDVLIEVLAASPDDLRTTVGLAYWKTIHMLDGFFQPKSPDHPIILQMGLHCSKNWKSKFEPPTKLLAPRYQAMLQSMEAPTFTEIERINILHDYIKAASKTKFNKRIVTVPAMQLREQSAKICYKSGTMQNLHWTKVTEALVFSTELLAKHHLERGKDVSEDRDPNHWFWYMDEAIKILRLGDLQCQIQAFSFSNRLAVWLKENKRGTAAKEEKHRTR